MPVTQGAFERLRRGGATSDNYKIRKMLETVALMQDAYEFYIPDVFDRYDSLSGAYNKGVYELAKQDRDEYLSLVSSREAPASALARLSADSLARLEESLN
jgi:hypothetical protein